MRFLVIFIFFISHAIANDFPKIKIDEDLTKNIKNINFEPAKFSSFRLRPELSLCMRSSFHSNLPGKLSKCKTTVQKYQKLNFPTQKNSKRHLILILRLAAPCHRITL